MHCPSLMMLFSASEGFTPYVQRLENSSWLHYYMFSSERWSWMGITTSWTGVSLRFMTCLTGINLQILSVWIFTRLSSGVFWWLINIRPEYLVFRQGDFCTLKPYVPCQFTQQFGYDQLYVGNPNPSLRFCGNLFEGARAWYYSVAGGTGAIFTLPHKTPNSYASFRFFAFVRGTSW